MICSDLASKFVVVFVSLRKEEDLGICLNTCRRGSGQFEAVKLLVSELFQALCHLLQQLGLKSPPPDLRA